MPDSPSTANLDRTVANQLVSLEHVAVVRMATTAAPVASQRGTLIAVLGIAACFASAATFSSESLRGTAQVALYVIVSGSVVGGEILKTAFHVLPLVAPLLALLVHLSPEKGEEQSHLEQQAHKKET